MIIVCPQCQAQYEFPAEQMGRASLRVRCSACGHITRLTPDGRTHDTELTSRGLDDETPAQAGYARIQRPLADGNIPHSGPPPVVRPQASTVTDLDENPVTLPPTPMPDMVNVGGRDERELTHEPSIVIDMGSLGNTPVPGSPTPTPTGEPKPRPALELGKSLDARESDLAVEIPSIPRRSLGRFAFSAVVFGVAGLLAFVWWRNDFSNILEAPGPSLSRAFTRGSMAPTSTAPVAAVVLEPTAMDEGLSARGLELRSLPKRGSGMLLRGELVNTSPTARRSITLRALLLQQGLAVRERTVACCDDFDLAAAQSVAQTPGHAHFTTKLNNLDSAPLAPGASRPFSIVFADTGDLRLQAVAPTVEVKFSEAVRVP